MMNESRSNTWLWILLSTIGAAGAAACGVAAQPTSSASTGWDCVNADVPNGTTVECTATNTAALTTSEPLPISYYCPPDNTSAACPPADAGASTPPPYEYDAGSSTPVGTGSGSTGGDTYDGSTTQPPVGTGSGSTGGNTYDAGTSGDASGTWGTDGGAGCGCGDDGGAVGTGSGSTSGNGNGNGGNGNGGNPHGGPPGNPGGGNPHTPGSSDDGGGYTSSGGDDAGGYTTGGGGDNGGGYTCDTGSGAAVCHKPPTCQPGTHPSACGACVPDGTTEDCTPPSAGGCWVTGGGFIVDGDGHDSFGGNAMPMKSGTIRGQWEHVDHGTGNKLHGEPSYIVCRHVNEPGPGSPNGPQHNFDINQVYFGGNARVFVNGTWFDGYWFDVMAEDHGEGKGAKAGGPDYYHITIRQMTGQTQSGVVVYDTEANMSGGNIQIHPPNGGHPFTSSALPSWVSLQP